MKETRFVLNQNNTLLSPVSLCLSKPQVSRYSSDIDFINVYVLKGLSFESIEWLKNLGVSEPCDTSIIDTGKIFEEGYVTTKNAIALGRYIFNLYKKGKIEPNILRRLNKMPMLTQEGSLKQANQLYMSNAYHPELPVEGLASIDVFISKEYIDNCPIYEWKSFLRAIGVSENINLSFKSIETEVLRRDFNWAIDFWDTHKVQPYRSWAGNDYLNPIYSYNLYIFSLYEHIMNYDFAKLFWAEAFKVEFNRENKRDCGYAYWQNRYHIEDNFFEWSLSNKPVIPTTQQKLEVPSNVYVRNLFEYCGNYLPVIDVDSEIPLEWIRLLNLKEQLRLEDLLLVLQKISEEQDEEKLKQNKILITNIYSKIAAELPLLHSTQVQLIRDWAKNNKILSKGDTFISPSDLKYVTIDGFNNKNQAFIGKQEDRDGIIKLLSIMGVKIITNDTIIPTFVGQETNVDIPTRLLSTITALAVLMRNCNEKKTYQECKAALQQRIENTSFYQCQKINLAYDDSGDAIAKTTFAQEGKFYFTGELSPAKIDPLLHPLCSYLGLKGKERELFVIMTERKFSGIVEYLEDKEYDVTDIKSEMLPELVNEDSVASVGGQIGGGIDKTQQIADSNEAKALVLAKLEKEGFDVSDVDYGFSVIDGVMRNGETYPLVVKSCKNWAHELYLNPQEWRQLFKPNSMLWLHLGNGVVAPIKAYELFTYQDKLSLTFDTVNLMMDDRISKIMEVMRYFNNVHLDVTTLNPDKRRADNLEEYLFNDNNLDNSNLETSEI